MRKISARKLVVASLDHKCDNLLQKLVSCNVTKEDGKTGLNQFQNCSFSKSLAYLSMRKNSKLVLERCSNFEKYDKASEGTR